MAHAGGRPSKYDPSFNQELNEYLKTTGTTKKSLPTIQGFALWLDVDSDTLNNWAKEHSEFFGTLKRLKEIQANQLINDGIYEKDANSTIIKLLLQNNHGMKERTDQTTNDKDLPSPILGGISVKK